MRYFAATAQTITFVVLFQMLHTNLRFFFGLVVKLGLTNLQLEIH